MQSDQNSAECFHKILQLWNFYNLGWQRTIVSSAKYNSEAQAPQWIVPEFGIGTHVWAKVIQNTSNFLCSVIFSLEWFHQAISHFYCVLPLSCLALKKIEDLNLNYSLSSAYKQMWLLWRSTTLSKNFNKCKGICTKIKRVTCEARSTKLHEIIEGSCWIILLTYKNTRLRLKTSHFLFWQRNGVIF